jgi:hypothetical protein
MVQVAKTTAIRLIFAAVPRMNASNPMLDISITDPSDGTELEAIALDNQDKVKWKDLEILIFPEVPMVAGMTYQVTIPQYAILYLIWEFSFEFTTRVEDVMRPSIVYSYPQVDLPLWKLNAIAPYVLFSEGVAAGLSNNITSAERIYKNITIREDGA